MRHQLLDITTTRKKYYIGEAIAQTNCDIATVELACAIRLDDALEDAPRVLVLGVELLHL